MVLIALVPLIVLAFASYRITRFFVLDDLSEGARGKLHLFLVKREQKEGRLKFFWTKMYQLTSCTFCAGFWVTAALYAIYAWNQSYSVGAHTINLFAITGLQALLHSWEGSDD